LLADWYGVDWIGLDWSRLVGMSEDVCGMWSCRFEEVKLLGRSWVFCAYACVDFGQGGSCTILSYVLCCGCCWYIRKGSGYERWVAMVSFVDGPLKDIIYMWSSRVFRVKVREASECECESEGQVVLLRVVFGV
jgi:hypothetical protein